MREFIFKRKHITENNYQCCRPGNQTGVYVRKEDAQELINTIQAMAQKIQNQAVVLVAVQNLEHHDKNFLCDVKKLDTMKKEHLAEIVRLTNNIDRICEA